jgi:serpin B
VLTDAVYFKGKWATPFKASATQNADFKVSTAQTATAPMMQNTDSYAYAETKTLQALEMPYVGGTLL